MKERKPKGSEGGSIQIMNLEADTLSQLQEIKDYYKVGTNSKAALLVIKNFISQKNEIQSLRLKLQEANGTIREQQHTLDAIAGNLRDYQQDRKFENRWGWLDDE